jgi:hypothetical protein
MAAGSTPSSALVERWNGTSWQQQAVAGPAGAGFGAVSCPAAQSCVAVGRYSTGQNNSATLAEAWNGTSWTVQPTPSAGQHAALYSVSCPTPSDCVAVGGNFISLHSGSTAFIERWNGTSWAMQKTPQPPHKDRPQFFSVSCATASSCTAMGGYSASNQAKLLVEHWNGTSWVRQHVPGAASVVLFHVSCPSATSCTAVGDSITAHWNGTAWTLQRPAIPAHATGHGVVLYDVSCPTASVCEAVGFYHAKRKTGRFRDRTVIEAN